MGVIQSLPVFRCSCSQPPNQTTFMPSSSLPPPSDVCVQCLRMSKRSLFVRLVPCRCLRGEEEAVTSLDYSHCSLETVPKEIFSFEKTLLELCLDANQIEELPKVRPQSRKAQG